MDANQSDTDKEKQPKQLRTLLIALSLFVVVVILPQAIGNSVDEPDESVVQTAVGKEMHATSKEGKAKIWLWATEHFDPNNAHDSASLAENIALSKCKPEYMKAVETYLRNEGASLPLERKKFLREFASDAPDHIEQ